MYQKHLSVLYYNARSVLPKFNELCALVETYTPDLVCIVETWLCEDINNSELAIPGYSIIRLDRNRHGGGVWVYSSDNVTCNIMFTSPEGLELVILPVAHTNCTTKHCITVLYRPPSSTVCFLTLFLVY